ncbi:MAG: hypothetical protein CMI53_00770 [Parcubacteria group bacterium]|jgi:membrane protein required for colicin V production|nr:hypothetical protein [Parcubacteria group bacterium]|tara:strand:- start:1131 stop:1649 length:519 start_codon:yes stop_codon:yes gene_type:complete
MYFSILDLILLLIIFIFISFGFALGLVQSIGALVGVVIGSWIAGLYYEPVGAWLEPILLGHGNTARVVAFIIIFVVINRATGLVFWFINKMFNIISIIPFTKSLNRILGALFGFLEGVLALGIILYFTSRFEISEWVTEILSGSNVALWLIEMGGFLSPLLPELLNQLKSVI